MDGCIAKSSDGWIAKSIDGWIAKSIDGWIANMCLQKSHVGDQQVYIRPKNAQSEEK